MTDRITVAELKDIQSKPKASKYGNRRTTVDGITFDSKGESDRYCDLRNLERGGKISDLRLQPKYALTFNGQHICDYVADFSYLEPGKGVVIEDFKGHRTREYILKRKMMLAIYGIEIRETSKSRKIPYRGSIR